MPRQTRSERTEKIVDHAAMLFARQSYEHTSLQQIADGLGYSKAGVLHYFPSKERIHDEVRELTLAELAKLIDSARVVEEGLTRDRRTLSSFVDLTYRYPGIAAFGVSQVTGQAPDDRELERLGSELSALFFAAGERGSRSADVRLVVAIGGLGAAAIEAVRVGCQEEWRESIVDAALRALGYD